MKRRALCIALLTGAVAWPRTGRSQSAPRKTARVAMLIGVAPDETVQRTWIEPLRRVLREHGHEEGRNLAIDIRWAEGRPERLPALAAELLALGPDVIVTAGPRPALAAKEATRSVPVVAAGVDNPVLMGLAATLARPGGNVTGISSWGIELLAKRLQLLKDFVPAATRFAVLANPNTATPEAQRNAEFEQRLGVKIIWVTARAPDEFDAAFATIARERVDGLVVLADSTFYVHRARLGELCAQSRLPSVWGDRSYLVGGVGLASYQSDFSAIARRAAALAALILGGAKPAEMPFERATKLDLVVSLKAARALGIKVPSSVLASADEVLE